MRVEVIIGIRAVHLDLSVYHTWELLIIEFVQGFIFLEEVLFDGETIFLNQFLSLESLEANPVLIIYSFLIKPNQVNKYVRDALEIARAADVEI